MIILWLLPVKFWKELHSDNTVASKIAYRIITIATKPRSNTVLICCMYCLVISYLNITYKRSTHKQEASRDHRSTHQHQLPTEQKQNAEQRKNDRSTESTSKHRGDKEMKQPCNSIQVPTNKLKQNKNCINKWEQIIINTSGTGTNCLVFVLTNPHY